MTKLNEAQQALLALMAGDPDGTIDAPEDKKLSRSLIRGGLAILVPRQGDESDRLTITAAGRAVLSEGAPEPPATGDEPADTAECTARGRDAEQEPPERTRRPRKTTPDGKLGTLVELMSRQEGATVEQMSEATGWQIHSVRGAMAGTLKKRFGFTITSEKIDGARIYRCSKES